MEAGEITSEKDECIKWNIENFRKLLKRSKWLYSPDFTYSGHEYYLSLEKESNTDILVEIFPSDDTIPNDLYLEFQLHTECNIVSKLHGITLHHVSRHRISVPVDFTEFVSEDSGTPLHDRLTVLLRLKELNGSGVRPGEWKTVVSSSASNSSTWECSECWVRNSVKESKCLACESPRSPKENNQGSTSVVNTTDKWECGICWVKNPSNESKYMSCKHPCSSTGNADKEFAENPEDAAKELREDETDSDYESLRKLQKDLEKLFLNREDGDVTLEVQGIEFPAHRIILQARSPVFSVMFKHKMKETNSGIVTIEDSDPKTFLDFLKYLYTGSTKHVSQENVCQLYTTSDKYEVMELKTKCVEFMKCHMTVETFCEYFSLAHMHTEEELFRSGIEFYCGHTIEIAKTVKWQIFLEKNSTVGNELFLKAQSRLLTKLSRLTSI